VLLQQLYTHVSRLTSHASAVFVHRPRLPHYRYRDRHPPSASPSRVPRRERFTLLDHSNMDPTYSPRPQSSHRHTLSDPHAPGPNGFNHGHAPMPLPGGPQALRGANGMNSMGRTNRRSMINDDGGLSRSPPLPSQTKSMEANTSHERVMLSLDYRHSPRTLQVLQSRKLSSWECVPLQPYVPRLQRAATLQVLHKGTPVNSQSRDRI